MVYAKLSHVFDTGGDTVVSVSLPIAYLRLAAASLTVFDVIWLDDSGNRTELDDGQADLISDAVAAVTVAANDE